MTALAAVLSTADALPGVGEDPTAFTYHWQACDAAGANCANIGGATAKVYRAATSDIGKRLRVQVTAKNASGTNSAATAPTGPVVHPAGATRIADGRFSITATSVKEPFRLVISGVEFAPRQPARGYLLAAARPCPDRRPTS